MAQKKKSKLYYCEVCYIYYFVKLHTSCNAVFKRKREGRREGAQGGKEGGREEECVCEGVCAR